MFTQQTKLLRIHRAELKIDRMGFATLAICKPARVLPGGIASRSCDDETGRERLSAPRNGNFVGLRGLAVSTVGVSLSLLLHCGTDMPASAWSSAVVFGSFPWDTPTKLVQIEPSKGSCASCIGVVDETLGTCNSTFNCVSSFDDRPKFFIAPWEYPGTLAEAQSRLNEILSSMGANIVAESEERYVHAKFTDKASSIVDDVEFLFSKPSEDATVVIRAASRAQNVADDDRNRRRLEEIRSNLNWEEVPILRNRRRALFFLESPWDSFGPEPPPTYDYNRQRLDFIPE